MIALEPASVRFPSERYEANVASDLFSEHTPAKIYHVNFPITDDAFSGTSTKQVAFEEIVTMKQKPVEETFTTEKSIDEPPSESHNSLFKSVEEESSVLPDVVKAAIASLALDDIFPGQQDKSLSIGSIGHHTGTCRPCAWWWKPNGCVKAESCEWCHLCDPGVQKLQKKARASDIKKRKSRCKLLPVGLLDPNRKLDD